MNTRTLCSFTAASVAGISSAFATSDYGPAVDRTITGCAKYYTSGYGHQFCVVHDMEGYYLSSISYMSRCDISVSVHYCAASGIDEGVTGGEVSQLVSEAYYAWHAGCWNKHSVACEHEGFASSPNWYTEAMYQGSAALYRHWCDKFGIAKDRNHIAGHYQWQDANWVSWVINNLGFDPRCNSHTDPGPYWDWNHYMALIQGVQNPPYYFDSNAQGWTSGNSLSAIAWSGSGGWPGIIYADQTGNDAFYYSPDTSYTGGGEASVNVSVYPQSGNTANHNMQMFFRTAAENSFSASKSSPIVTYTAQNNWVRINLDVNAVWPKYYNQTITGLRLDVDNSNSSTRWIVNHVIPQGSLRWRFDSDAMGWTSGNSLSTITWTACCGWPGIIYADQTGNDPQFVSTGGWSMLGGINDILHVRVFPQSGTTANHDMQVFFATAGQNYFSEPKSMTIYYTAKDAWADLYFNVGQNGYWNGDYITQIRVDPDQSNHGNRWIIDSVQVEHLTSPAAIPGPSIGAQPQAQSANVGSSATLSVFPNGTAPFTYQWRKNGANISSATAQNYTVSSAQLSDAGLYDVVVSNAGGTVTSTQVQLVINSAPQITSQPQDQNVYPGGNVTFSVTATGTAPLTYQWQFDGNPIAGATASSLLLTNVQASDSGSYSAVVANSLGSVTSSNAMLIVSVADSPPSIVAQPQNLTRNQGGSATFGVTVAGSWPLHYQWYLNDIPLSGATQNTYTDSNVQAADAGSYRVVVTNDFGSASSAPATLTVIIPPTIATQPQSQAVIQGANVTFTVEANGTAPFAYQWRKGGTPISGATSTSYSLSNVQAADAATYTVVVTNAAGSVTSGNAVLTVYVAPAITTQPVGQTLASGSSVTFTVTATGNPAPAYQWQRNGVNLSGATASSYTKSNIQSADVGLYSVVVSNLAGTVTSTEASLALTAAIAFQDTFESGNMGQWTTAASPATALGISTAQNHTSGGANSADANSSLNKMYHNLGQELEGHARLVFYAYDNTASTVNSGQTRWFGEMRAYSGAGYGDGGLQQVFAIGRYGVGFGTGNTGTLAGQTVNTGNYQGRVVSGANTGWFNLSVQRSVGWHKFEIDRAADGTTINFYVDGVLGGTVTAATMATWDTTTIGSVAAGNTAGDAWFDDVVVQYYDPPSITGQPAGQTVAAGGSATFSVTANNNAQTYQWRLNGVNLADGGNISGAASPTLTLDNVQGSDAGSYTVVVGNGVGPTVSTAAVLLVAPTITTQPISRTDLVGATVSFTVAAVGQTPMTYQWKKNGGNLTDSGNVSGATTATLTLLSVSLGDAASYTVVVTSAAGSATSAAATLTVLEPPAIATQPQGQAVAAGATVTFSVVATGAAPLAYQWNLGSSPITGATDSSFTKSNVQSADAGNYTVTVTNSAGSAVSDAAILSVNNPPILGAIPNRTIHAGTTVVVSSSVAHPDLDQTLTFTLDAGAPAAATLDAATGVFRWTATEASINTTSSVTLRVADNGVPSLSDAKSFTIAVVTKPSVLSATVSEGKLTLTWNAIAGQVYYVQSADDLANPDWNDLVDVTADGPTASCLDATVSDSGPIPQRFYRILVGN